MFSLESSDDVVGLLGKSVAVDAQRLECDRGHQVRLNILSLGELTFINLSHPDSPGPLRGHMVCRAHVFVPTSRMVATKEVEYTVEELSRQVRIPKRYNSMRSLSLSVQK